MYKFQNYLSYVFSSIGRNKIAELEKLLEKEREEKEKYEGLLEQRHMQVSQVKIS